MTSGMQPTGKRRPGRPRKIEPGLLRERVLEAATGVFASEGVGDASSDHIADLAGIPRQTIYRMFGSKRGVFEAAVDRALSRVVDHMTASLSGSTHVRGRDITSINVGAFLELVTREPKTIRMLQLAETSGSSKTGYAARAVRNRIENAVSSYVQQTWEGRRPLTAREARLGARLIVAVVEAGAADQLENGDFEIEHMAEFLTDFIRTGFTTLRQAEPD